MITNSRRAFSPFVPMKELLNDADSREYAVPSFCVWSAELMVALRETAEEMRSPVILMNGWVEHELVSPALLGPMARCAWEGCPVPAALHLDHGDSLERVRACLDAGYSSVMLDFSNRPYRENVEGMQTTVALARETGVTVEGELGSVGKIDDETPEGACDSGLTNPDEARRFVEETGIDALAVAVGNAHGNYTVRPQLDFPRLEAIRKNVAIPLVLHGGSGTPPEDVQRGITNGIAKINVASEVVRAMRESLMQQWGAKQNPWVPTAQVQALQAVKPVLQKWITLCGSAGKA